MRKVNPNEIQVNVIIPKAWKNLLIELARKEAYERNEHITYLHLVYEAIQKQYSLENETPEVNN